MAPNSDLRVCGQIPSLSGEGNRSTGVEWLGRSQKGHRGCQVELGTHPYSLSCSFSSGQSWAGVQEATTVGLYFFLSFAEHQFAFSLLLSCEEGKLELIGRMISPLAEILGEMDMDTREDIKRGAVLE